MAKLTKKKSVAKDMDRFVIFPPHRLGQHERLLTDIKQEQIYYEQKVRLDAMGPSELKAEMNAIRRRQCGEEGNIDPNMRPVLNKLMRHATRRSMLGTEVHPDTPGDLGAQSPGFDMRIGGVMGGKSQVKPGDFMDVDDVDFQGDEKNQTAATGIITRNRKWMADQEKLKHQRKVTQARKTYTLESRSMVNMYGIGGPGPDPYNEAAKTLRNIYGNDIADEVVGDLGKGGKK